MVSIHAVRGALCFRNPRHMCFVMLSVRISGTDDFFVVAWFVVACFIVVFQ